MTAMRAYQVAALSILIFGTSLPITARTRINVISARVRFLATGTLIRHNWGTNEDVYLAELEQPDRDEQRIIRLVDEYPSYAPPLPTSLLKARDGEMFKLRRDENCDITFGAMVLRTAPGDPLALLPERLQYMPMEHDALNPATTVACYRIVRDKRCTKEICKGEH